MKTIQMEIGLLSNSLKWKQLINYAFAARH